MIEKLSDDPNFPLFDFSFLISLIRTVDQFSLVFSLVNCFFMILAVFSGSSGFFKSPFCLWLLGELGILFDKTFVLRSVGVGVGACWVSFARAFLLGRLVYLFVLSF